MSFTYSQSTGELTDPTGISMGVGYAGGNCGKNPEGVNNPDMQGEHDIGPLPCGKYKFAQPIDHTNKGPFAIPLIPDPANDMLGRGGFYMHGDTTPGGNASEGCVVMPRTVRNDCWESDDHDLEVVP